MPMNKSWLEKVPIKVEHSGFEPIINFRFLLTFGYIESLKEGNLIPNAGIKKRNYYDKKDGKCKKAEP